MSPALRHAGLVEGAAGTEMQEAELSPEARGAVGLGEADTASGDGREPSFEGPVPDPARRLMVYSARFDLLVSNPATALEGFLKRVEELGGYLQRREDFAVTCRVPAARFQALLAEIPSLGTVVSQSMAALDVTREHRDLALRIENAERARERLLVLLGRAEKVEDTLKIEAELRRLTEEIERMKGELKLLSERIAFSTVEVLFRSAAPAARPVRRRTRSRFEWINEIGVERVLQDF